MSCDGPAPAAGPMRGRWRSQLQDLDLRSPNGIRTRLSTLRAWSGRVCDQRRRRKRYADLGIEVSCRFRPQSLSFRRHAGQIRYQPGAEDCYSPCTGHQLFLGRRPCSPPRRYSGPRRELTSAPHGDAVAQPYRTGVGIGPIAYGRIISLSSCSTMWQCQTKSPGMSNRPLTRVTSPG
jgi:hypothetical protein